MDITDFFRKISDYEDSTKTNQAGICASEAWHIWSTLFQRYQVIETTQILVHYAKDQDLKMILQQGLKVLANQVEHTEALAIEYGIPLPGKSSTMTISQINIEEITDQHIFRVVFLGMKEFLQLHLTGFVESVHPKLRASFKHKLTTEMELYDKMMFYGKTKGWTPIVPKYRV